MSKDDNSSNGKKWKWIERVVSITVVLSMFVAWQSDRSKWTTILDTLIKNDEKRTEYWNRQNEINGRIIEYMRHDGARTGAGP